jgi:hypothetical protein
MKKKQKLRRFPAWLLLVAISVTVIPTQAFAKEVKPAEVSESTEFTILVQGDL